jgi:methylmalonyl-CoA mutase N-terminal domain/subunit
MLLQPCRNHAGQLSFFLPVQEPHPNERNPTLGADLARWRELARQDLRDRDPSSLERETPDGLQIKPLYTAADLEQLSQIDTTPGVFPFVRGPRATMYANRPWTIRQYAGFSTAEESNAFYKANLAAGSRACRWRSISPPTAATTPTTRA